MPSELIHSLYNSCAQAWFFSMMIFPHEARADLAACGSTATEQNSSRVLHGT